jgi:vanillate O-demethylase ferredoxin subunit
VNHPTDLIEVRVARKNVEAEGITSFEFVRPDGGTLPAFEPGAHLDIHVPGGLIRQYSLCNPANETHRYQIAVLRDPGSRGGSVAMHDQLNEGDLVKISAPRNHFPLHGGVPHALLFGGGIGITPVLCMAEHLSRAGKSFELHYCTRAQNRTAFHDAIKAAPFADKVDFHFDDGAAEQKPDIAAKLASASPDTHLYVCGPKGFMDAVLGKARELGWPESRIHFEYFAAEVVHRADDGTFAVEVSSSGKVIPVAPDQTIAQALAAAGIEVPLSCEQGVCGTCLTRVVSGTPDHRDMYLTPAEQEANDQILVCCSRSKSPKLVLDL